MAPATEPGSPVGSFQQSFHEDDAPSIQRLLQRHPELKELINAPIGPFDSPPILGVKSRQMLDALLDAGADINAKSRWWAGGFCLLHSVEPGLAAYAIERGACVDAHAAARLGLLDRLRELMTHDPSLVNARGGDGQTPLHFASNVAVAEYLLDHGANIDARDVDHESTPAQWMIRERQEVARFLVQRGCYTDIFIPAALGDETLARKHLAANPDCVRMRINDETFQKIDPRAGGTIYQWALGWHRSPHDVAREFGHGDVLRLLLDHSPPDVRLMSACWAGDEATVRFLLAEDPKLVESLPEAIRRQVADAARNNNTRAVRTMLAAGLPVDAVGQHRGTPLHWAAFHGNAEMARVLLRFNPPLEQRDADFQSTPLGWAIHGSEHGWYCRSGDYGTVVEALLDAGANLEGQRLAGSAPVKTILQRRGVSG